MKLFHKLVPKIKYNDGEPCDHLGCLNHRSHPCEDCRRIGAKGVVMTNPFQEGLEREPKSCLKKRNL